MGGFASQVKHQLEREPYGNAPSPGDPTGLPVVPPFEQISSAAGTQLIEMYWASLLRDLAFAGYPTNATAAAAAAELTGQSTYRGPRDSSANVTPALLFRGTFRGETIGPYMSQFMFTPTAMGQQPMDQLMNTYVAPVDMEVRKLRPRTMPRLRGIYLPPKLGKADV